MIVCVVGVLIKVARIKVEICVCSIAGDIGVVIEI